MLAFEWNEKYYTGIDTIDNQHKKLFENVDDLYTAIREHKSREDILLIAEELENYTHYHFGFEEDNLAKYNFPYLEQHIKLHDQFRQKVAQFKTSLSGSQQTNPLEMLDFLMDWLVDHILIKDKKYIPLLKDKV